MPESTRPVDRYEILRELGRGGMAVVYLARQIDLNRLVALKELSALRSSDAEFAQRFLREARVAGGLTHANIVTVYDYFERQGTPYIAMEYVERGSLRPYVGRMSLPQIGGVLEGLLAGLSQAEQHGIVHRDLKPENLLVTTDGRVKIADFGIAKATNTLRTGPFLTQTGTTVGTPTYIAPEQAMALEVGPWTDLYSVGIMAFEFFVNRPPFADTDEPIGIVLRHINEPIPRVSDLVPSTDPRIADWIERMVAKEPAERPQSAGEAWEGLEEGLLAVLGPRWRRGAQLLEPGEQPVGPPPPVGLTTPHSRPTAPVAQPWSARTAAPQTQLQAAAAKIPDERRKRKWPIIIAGLAVAGVIAAAAGALGGGNAGAPPAAVETGELAAQTTSPSTSTGPAVPTAAADSGVDSTNLAEAAKTARDLARQYSETAKQIAQLSVSSAQKGTRDQLVNALEQAAKAYGTVARAAGRGDVTSYTSALVVAGQKRQAVQLALAAFEGNSSVPSPGDQSTSNTSDGSSPGDAGCAGDSSSDDPSDDSCEP